MATGVLRGAHSLIDHAADGAANGALRTLTNSAVGFGNGLASAASALSPRERSGVTVPAVAGAGFDNALVGWLNSLDEAYLGRAPGRQSLIADAQADKSLAVALASRPCERSL